ncbi:MAG TPA: hypothetical protein VJZ00_02285 [Thermoanaerobaculia bacterium]|nr:hypothetical protein [Thermoanaerobaculia bacterium]
MSRSIAALAIASLLTFPALADDPDLIPNSIKYSDNGLKPATGRAGDIAVEARALLGADGVTDVELTTGSFDGDVAPTGALNRVQVKAAYDTDNALTRNFSANGSFTSVRLADLGLAPHEKIQIQTNAHSADYARTGVVTMIETVKFRPDVRAAALSIAPFGIEGHPVNFYLNVNETNGDLGARADCVLRVDGVEVDRATNIWVDARSSVGCAMTHIFNTTGAHQVQMSVENVSPGDWNPNNNSTPVATVNIHSASEVVAGGSYVASARETIHESIGETRMDESLPQWENQDTHNTDLSDTTRLDAAIPVEYDFNTLKVSVGESSDGQAINSLVSGDRPRKFGECAELRFGRTFSFYGCVADGVTTIHYARGSSRTRYYSRWWGVFTDVWTGDRHTYDHDMNMNMTSGGNRFYGETVSLQLIATDATHAWQIDPFMNMVPWSDPDQHDGGCYQAWQGEACWTVTTHNGGRNGDASQ